MRFALAADWFDKLARFLQNSAALDGSEAGGGVFPGGFFAPFWTRESQNQHGGEKKGRTMNPLIQLKKVTALFVVAFACLALLPTTQAVSPTPDGCYPNFTTAEGCDALSLLTTGSANTGLGWRSLFSNTDGSFNTAVGAGTLVLNTGDSNTAVGTVALLLNTTGTLNTAIGTDAMVYNDTGGDNTAVGAFALVSTWRPEHGHWR